VPSLRNVAVRAPYMHDGRFRTLREVVDFYDHQVQASPNLDPVLRGGGPPGRGGRGGRGARGGARRLNLSSGEKDALVAYLESLTDTAFLTAARFSNPFVDRR
jgi:cytochrome c peroxidase